MEKKTQQRKFTDKEVEMFLELLPEMMEQVKEKFVTVRDFYSDYLNEVKVLHSKSYYQSQITSYKHLLKFISEDTLLKEITKKQVNDMMLKIQNHAPRGINVYLRNFKAAFNRAVEWDYIKTNPFEKVRKAKFQQVEEATINREELYDIWLLMDNQVVRDIATISFFTGMRLGEIVNLKWSDVDIDKGMITVGSENFQTKTKSYRKIAFGLEVECSLVNHLQNKNKSEYVFTKPNGFKYTSSHVSRLFKRGVRKWGKNLNIHFHSLRHSFATNLQRLTNNIFMVQKLLGHSQISTTQRYTHFDYEQARSILELL